MDVKSLLNNCKGLFLALAALAAPGLRAEYPDRFVEYVESDGSQYVAVGDVLRSNTVAVVDFMLTAKDSVERAMFGANYCFAYLATNRRYVRGKLGYSGPDKDVRLLYRYDVAAQKIYQSPDSGVSWTQVSANNASEQGEGAGADACLFWAAGSTRPKASMRVYGCSITNGASLACDLYPCVKNGRPGLFDAVSKTILYDAAGSATAFAVGPTTDVPPACFDSGYEVVGGPLRFGTPTPAYGIDDCTRGSSVTFALAGADTDGRYLSEDGKSRARLANATFSIDRGVAETVESDSFARTVSGIAKVSWNFADVEHALTIVPAADGEASYMVDGQAATAGETIWVADAATVTVRVVPAFGTRFVKWTDGTGDLGDSPEIQIAPLAGGLSLQAVFQTAVCVNKDSLSAIEDGTAANPYKTIQAGIDAARFDGDVIVVAADSYPATYAIASEITSHATYKTTLRGWTGNPRDIVVDAGKSGRCLKLTNGSAVEALTLTNGYLAVHGAVDERFGAGAYLSAASSMRNCVVTDCHVASDMAATATATAALGGGGIYAQGVSYGASAVVSDTLVEFCSVLESSASHAKDHTLYGGGVCIYGAALLTNSIVRNCRLTLACGQYVGYGYGGGVAVYSQYSTPKSVVADCTIVGNCVTNTNGRSNRMFGGGYSYHCRNSVAPFLAGTAFTNNFCIYQGGGAYFKTDNACVRDCAFVANKSLGSGGGVMSSSASLTNCLVVLNSGGTAVSASTAAASKTSALSACTIADNRLSGLAVAFGHTDVFVRNTILCNACTGEMPPELLPGGSAAERVDHCLIGGNPKFKSRGNGDYRLKYDSPCRGQGLVEPWMTGTADMSGAPRLDPKDGTVDIGCCQHLPSVGCIVLVE